MHVNVSRVAVGLSKIVHQREGRILMAHGTRVIQEVYNLSS